jgi:hypothetical protein
LEHNYAKFKHLLRPKKLGMTHSARVCLEIMKAVYLVSTKVACLALKEKVAVITKMYLITRIFFIKRTPIHHLRSLTT